MQTYACLFRQQDISCNDHIFYRVCDSLKSETLRILICIHHASFDHGNVLAVCKYTDSCLLRFFHPFTV